MQCPDTIIVSADRQKFSCRSVSGAVLVIEHSASIIVNLCNPVAFKGQEDVQAWGHSSQPEYKHIVFLWVCQYSLCYI